MPQTVARINGFVCSVCEETHPTPKRADDCCADEPAESLYPEVYQS